MARVKPHPLPSDRDERDARSANRWRWLAVGLAVVVVGTLVLLMRPRPRPVAQLPALQPLPTSSATTPTDLWSCKSGVVPPPRQRQNDRLHVRYAQEQDLAPARRVFGNAYVGVHRCQSTWLAECPKSLSWNTCRYAPHGDIRFDADGYVVAIRVHRRKRGDSAFDGGSFRVAEVPVELGTTTLDEVVSKKPSVRPARIVIDPEFGTIEVLTYDYFELEFDTVKGAKILGAINLIH